MAKISESKLSSDYLKTAYDDKQKTISLLDQKANILIGIIGISLSILFSNFLTKTSNLGEFALVIAPLLVSGLMALLVLFPRQSKKGEYSSLLYFLDAINSKEEELYKKLKSNNQEFFYKDYIKNIKALSKIVEKKIRFLKRSYIWLVIGVIIKLLFEIRSLSS